MAQLSEAEIRALLVEGRAAYPANYAALSGIQMRLERGIPGFETCPNECGCEEDAECPVFRTRCAVGMLYVAWVRGQTTESAEVLAKRLYDMMVVRPL